jgi:hypothetical protein
VSYRRHSVRLIGLFWLVPVAVLAPFMVDPTVPDEHRLSYAAVSLPFVLLATRTFMIGVFTRTDGVKVRGVLWTWKLRWDEIRAFEWGVWRGWGKFDCGIVRREDGSQITVFALNPPFEFTSGLDRRVPDLLDALNRELASARGWSEPPASGAPDPSAPPPPEATAHLRSTGKSK